jgi:hypothetical protein
MLLPCVECLGSNGVPFMTQRLGQNGAFTAANRNSENADIARRFKPIRCVTSPVAKKTLAPSGKSLVLLRVSCLFTEGRLRNRHERWVQDAMDADMSPASGTIGGRRNRVVPASRR